MITLNRLNNAISKIGPLNEYRYQIYELVCDDIIEELCIYNIQNKERKQIKIFIMDKLKLKF